VMLVSAALAFVSGVVSLVLIEPRSSLDRQKS
jgi:hypothetical protein